MTARRFVGGMVSGLLLASVAWAGPEAWSDKRLSATEGLVLWLDAAKQTEARQALGKPAVLDQQPLDAWFDASGHGRHLTQPGRDAQPRLQVLKDGAAVRFDGLDDFLFLSSLKQEFHSATVFVVAAPQSNGGHFRGLVAGGALGKNDYTHGFTIDLGPFASPRWQSLNVEGAGFGGAANLITQPTDFGVLHQLTTVIDAGEAGVKVFVNGQKAGQRKRDAGKLGFDQVFVGARYYSNEPRPPFVQGFLDGVIAEVLIYDRALSDEHRQTVEKYLAAKYAGVTVAGGGGKRLVTVKDPPPVQMLVPGFRVRTLPLDLPNINNVRYRADGKLVALAYDGDVYLLSDTDGDGLEDKAEKFWDNQGRLRAPIGMALTPPNYKHGTGLFVAGKGKVSLIADTDGDGKADKETVVATGWKELPHGVDALGVAVDKDGSVLFGLGAANFTNAYLIDKAGKAQYDLKNERGTIMRVSPDFSKREIVATGIRFPVALALRDGDLFASDQEGATWLPNGNPLDELLHIQPGRHYGFPPRHPKHLPDVIDEPSIFDYTPQHQSVCGLIFNEGVNGGLSFGLERWKGDALLSGYSRGKLYRTQLARTPAGFVAQSQLLACLNMLTVDSCVSPQGDLIVAVHSGMPDWGSGPTGKGKLHKITYSEPRGPQPVAVWAAGPREVRIAFDQPLELEHLRKLTKQIEIEYGPYVHPGDRFESLRPGYAVVQQQLAAPRHELSVLGTAVSPDRRTLVLTTGPHPEAVRYAVTLPGSIDLGYDLTGVAATWQGPNGTAWTGWLPHLDLAVSQAFTGGSADHEALVKHLREAGRLTLKTQLDLWQMLRPAVQPGSTLDHKPPPEQVTVTLTSSVPIEVKTPAATEKGTDDKTNHVVRLRVEAKEGQPVPLEITLPTGEPMPVLAVSFTTQEDARPRPLALHRFLQPWATLKAAKVTTTARVIPELEGGSWVRGRAVFMSEQAGCAKCHAVRGAGGKIGPDLSNLVHRDYESVLRDVRLPSAALNPDFLTSIVALADGRVLTGLVRDDKDKLIVTDSNAIDHPVSKSNIDAIQPDSQSLMPEGIDKVLGAEKMRDLLTFLLTEPLTAAPLEIPGAPPPRTRAELEAVLKGSEKPTKSRPLTIVLSAGPKDHGPGEHDYPLWQRRWVKLFDLAENVAVIQAQGWPTAAMWEKADLMVFYSNNPGWSAARTKELDSYLQRGGGLVFIHYAVDGHKDADAFAQRIGLAWKGGASRFRHGPLELSFGGSKHPIARGFDKLKLIDESYWKLTGDPKDVQVLASGMEDGSPQPLLWTREQGKGRVFVSIPGHYTWSFDDPLFRLLLLRGMAWSAGESVDRFNSLAGEGVRWAD